MTRLRSSIYVHILKKSIRSSADTWLSKVRLCYEMNKASYERFTLLIIIVGWWNEIDQRDRTNTSCKHVDDIGRALALQLVSLSIEATEKEKERCRNELREREGEHSIETQRISLEWRRARCALLMFMCRVESERGRKPLRCSHLLQCAQLRLHALMIIRRREPKTNQM
jgi:hypothetical protein